MEISIRRAILWLWSPDKPGIVAEVSQFIFAYGGNIIESSQHNDPVSDTFLMRIEWDLSGFALPEEKIEAAFEPIAMKFEMAIFVSQYDHCLYDLLLRNRERETHADIRLIISNHEKLRPVAELFGAKPYHQAHERGVKIIGATSHYVKDNIDEGPIIEQDVTRVSHRDSIESMVRKGRDLEHRVMALGNRTVVFE